MDYTEPNKLIAEFMGIPKQLHLYESPYTGIYVDANELEYHSSWDWLMPVVERIEITHQVHVVDNVCFIIGVNVNNFSKIRVEGESKTIATYKAVIEFIKWYN